MKILVLCTGNSARSILLESILNHASGGRVTAYSAGSHPAGRVHPASIRLLDRIGHDVSRARSKSWDEFEATDAPEMDAVITVCDAAANETCPYWPGAPVRAHWGVADPSAAPEEVWDDAFGEVYATLAHRARLLLELPLETMAPKDLKTALDRIGTLP